MEKNQMTQNNYNFNLVNCDTDSITITKPNGDAFTETEKRSLLDELNSLFPELINWADDGYFQKFIVIKAKNYVMWDGKKLKYKGSGIKDQKKERALQEMLHELIRALIDEKQTSDLVNIYHKYIIESQNISDINRWSKKVTVTKKLMESTRKNETKVADAIKGENFSEGDKVWIYDTIDGMVQKFTKGEPEFYKTGEPRMVENKTTKLVKYWNKDENKAHYLQRVYKTLAILKNIIPMKEFINYSIKKNKPQLDVLLLTNVLK